MLSAEQIANRKLGIGASEAAVAIGLSKYMSPYELYEIKTGLREQEDISEKPAVYWGNVLEEVVAQEYAKQMNVKVRRCNKTLYHPEHKHILCHLDRVVVNQNKILECKTASVYSSNDWGPTGTDIVKDEYIVQVQIGMALKNAAYADLAVLIGGNDFRIYHFKRDDELIKEIITRLNEFWQCVVTKTPPALRDRSDVELQYPQSNGNLKPAEPTILKTVDRLKEIKIKKKLAEEEEKKLQDELAIYLADAEGIAVTDSDKPLVTYKTMRNGKRQLRIL